MPIEFDIEHSTGSPNGPRQGTTLGSTGMHRYLELPASQQMSGGTPT